MVKQLDILITEFCIPTESDFVCGEMIKSKSGDRWCEKNCGVTNNGKYPEMRCYKEWLRRKQLEKRGVRG